MTPDTRHIATTNDQYFLSALNKANINPHHPYTNGALVADCLRAAFKDAYGGNGTQTPLNKMSACQSAFIAAA